MAAGYNGTGDGGYGTEHHVDDLVGHVRDMKMLNGRHHRRMQSPPEGEK